MDFPKQTVLEFARFLAVGGLCYLLGLALLYLFTEHLGLHYLVSLVIAMFIVSTIGWAINRNWTFKSINPQWLAEARRYLAANLSAWLITLALVALLVAGFGVNYLLASAIIAALMAVFNFLLHRHWSFRKK